MTDGVRDDAGERRVFAAVSVEVPGARSFARDEHFVARRRDEQRGGIRLDASGAAAAAFRHDVRLARLVRCRPGIDVIRVAGRFNARRAFGCQRRARERRGEPAEAAGARRVETNPAALERGGPIRRRLCSIAKMWL